MSISYLEEFTRKIPVDSPLRIKFDEALKEIDALREQQISTSEDRAKKKPALDMDKTSGK